MYKSWHAHIKSNNRTQVMVMHKQKVNQKSQTPFDIKHFNNIMVYN